MLASAWLWTSLLAGATFLTVQGAAIVFAPALAIFAIASLILLLGKQSPAYILSALGAFVFAIIALPLTALGESGLFIEASAPFAIILILLFIYLVPLIWPSENAQLRSFWITLIGTASVTLFCFVASLLVPAYSKDAPRGLSISHFQSSEIDQAYWTIRGHAPVPAALRAIAPFEAGDLPIYTGPRQIAPAPELSSALFANISADVTDGATRTLTLEITAPETDRLSVFVYANQRPTSLTLNDHTTVDSAGLRNVVCSGRACKNTRLKIELPAEAEDISLDIFSTRFGLGPEGQALVNARPNWTIPRQSGDTRISHMQLAPPS